jgi:hypothetical protein
MEEQEEYVGEGRMTKRKREGSSMRAEGWTRHRKRKFW